LITLCLNTFADLVSWQSITIAFHNLGNIIADGKLSRFLFKTSSNLYDFILFGSARDVNIFWKEEGRLSLNYPCIYDRTLSLYVSSRLRTFNTENNDLIFYSLEFLTPPQVTIPYLIWGLTREL